MSMNAVVIYGPHDIHVDKRPLPVLQEDYDAIVRVTAAGICGSELHPYRGHQKTTFGHIMGHEYTGIVTAVGKKVTTVRTGDRVFGLFSTSCLRCWFCKQGYTNRCTRSLALGTAQINGCQAEFVRVPDADGSLMLAPPDIEDELLVMMSDIFPTGYYGAMRAISQLSQPLESSVVVCIGCGIVGICAVLTAVKKGCGAVFCVDTVEDRLTEAKRMGGIPLHLGVDDIQAAVLKATDGRGADAVIENVGNEAALTMAFDLLRVCGHLSSVGFHQSAMPFTALQGYQKNINLNMGRAPVRAVLEEALEVFVQNKNKFTNAISHRLPLEDAAMGYELFSTQKARKVILRP
ncbi:hypothetical protein Sste5346_010161 [Sporothrix stenoceras]|uniref:Enoyl reductase (ER) domain-containing protein n=1 Tax=Sporothrix stenoceras TaxID=5173 RepID=A0ABR3YHE6_9PEZI